uniref:Uncharacterized protein n=1 Tax=Amphimedon queenslandica TaxID=400682 RepID=A0A1X7UQ87_AMPQE
MVYLTIFTKTADEFVECFCNKLADVKHHSSSATQQSSYFAAYFGVEGEWHFSATSHGKGACDGLGAMNFLYCNCTEYSQVKDLLEARF